MDNIGDYIIPIIIVISFIYQAVFGKKKEPEEETGPESSEDPSEAYRRVREEIQRRIAENQQRQQGTSPEAPAREEPYRPAAPVMRPATPVARPVPAMASAASPSADRMRDMQRQIEEARKKALEEQKRLETLKSETALKGASGAYTQRKPRIRRASRGDLVAGVISDLQDPVRARRALLFSEVFGTPVGMRKSGEIRPMWEL